MRCLPKVEGSTTRSDCPNNDAMTKRATAMVDLGLTTTKDVLRGVLSPPTAAPGRRVLDIGCGGGPVTRLLRRSGLEAFGIEPNADLLVDALADAARPAPSGCWIAARAEHLPVESDSVDAVLFCNSLHHIPPARQLDAVVEAARVLRPAGELVVIEPVAEGDYFELLRPLDDETAVRAAAQEALGRAADEGILQPLESAGFSTFVAWASPAEVIAAFTRADPARAERARPITAEIARRFRKLGAAAADGKRRFAQPMTLQRLKKPV
jgi:ubiquinone/menaquinone biosynthesis C-methylase UbiE